MATHRALRVIAIFEAIKGFVVLAAGAGVLSLLHRDAELIAERIVRHLSLDPTAHYAGVFLELASRITDRDIWFVALTALAYGILRFVEAYGLWNERTWAEWLAVLSGALYVPIELASIARHVTLLKITLLTLNIIVVVYIALLLVQSRQNKTNKATTK